MLVLVFEASFEPHYLCCRLCVPFLMSSTFVGLLPLILHPTPVAKKITTDPASITTEMHCVDNSDNFSKNDFVYVAKVGLRLIYSPLTREKVPLRFPLELLPIRYITICLCIQNNNLKSVKDISK